jgi:hypothetical protein
VPAKPSLKVCFALGHVLAGEREYCPRHLNVDGAIVMHKVIGQPVREIDYEERATCLEESFYER